MGTYPKFPNCKGALTPSHVGGGAGIHHCPESCQKFQQSKNKIRNNICQTEKLRDENAARKAKRKMSLKKKSYNIQWKYHLKHIQQNLKLCTQILQLYFLPFQLLKTILKANHYNQTTSSQMCLLRNKQNNQSFTVLKNQKPHTAMHWTFFFWKKQLFFLQDLLLDFNVFSDSPYLQSDKLEVMSLINATFPVFELHRHISMLCTPGAF